MITKATIDKMGKTIFHLEEQLKGIGYFGYSTTTLIDTIKVKTIYGQKMPIKEIAIMEVDGRAVYIHPFDEMNCQPIVEACSKSGYNARATSKKEVCFVLEAPTMVSKKKLKKQIGVLGEETKVSIRNIRRNYMKDIKEESDTERRLGEKQIQSATVDFCKKIDMIVKQNINYI